MRVLVACEYSGRVRDAFLRRGHDAMSCDLLPTDVPGPHYQGDVRDVLGDGWDLMVAHPPCTHLAVSGARWFKEKQAEQAEALEFVRLLLDAPIPRIALENPVSIILTWTRVTSVLEKPKVDRRISDEVKQAIRSASGTQKEIAAAFGLSQGYVCRIRRGDVA